MKAWKSILSFLFFLVSLVLSASQAYGHARLKSNGSIPPRNASASLKAPPCGNVAYTGNPTSLAAGATVTVTWEETINHPGKYLIEFDSNNDGIFETNLATVIDTQDTPIQNGAYHQYSRAITVPSTPCNNCTIRLKQSMEENPAAPSFYYSCADVKIVPSGTPVAPPTPRPAPDDTNLTCSP